MATPHKCPVCQGRGTVPPGFYDEINTGTSIKYSETNLQGLWWVRIDLGLRINAFVASPYRT